MGAECLGIARACRGRPAVAGTADGLLRLALTLGLLRWALAPLQPYQPLYTLLSLGVELALALALAGVASRLLGRLLRRYGAAPIRKLGTGSSELLLLLEFACNAAIALAIAAAFAQGRGINLLRVSAGLSLGGLAITAAARRLLEQIWGTLVLYLDRPLVPGEYVRINRNSFSPRSVLRPRQGESFLYGRVDAIGLRSTRIRLAGKSTLYIVPNSLLVARDFENLSRGRKILVLLYLDFERALSDRETAWLKRTVQSETDGLLGIDPGSTRISLLDRADGSGTRAQVSLFVLGASQDSMQLRKHLLEFARHRLAARLAQQGLTLANVDTTLYVDVPITV